MNTMPDQYFFQLNSALQAQPKLLPTLLIDLDQLDQNIEQANTLVKKNTALRIVVKSLPCADLLQYIMAKTGSKNLMVFHEPFLAKVIPFLDESHDILLGKPMPAKTVAHFYKHFSSSNKFNPFSQIQWLVDSLDRLAQYLEIAKTLQTPLRINLEIDVGLHRGGFDALNKLSAALAFIKTNVKWLTFSGLMGYDPHVVKLPKLLASSASLFREANDFYRQAITLIKTDFSDLWNKKLTFNGGGSPTLSFHQQENSAINDIAIGSCFVKPAAFDIPSLHTFSSACFIATPVLKALGPTRLPGPSFLSALLRFFQPNWQQSYFIYGGYWKADYCYPVGTSENKVFGSSTNQSMINSPKTAKLAVDDFVFLRPQQSEFVFLQFGNIKTFRKMTIVEKWPVFKH